MKMHFTPAEVKPHFTGGKHRLYEFENGYGASVVPEVDWNIKWFLRPNDYELAVLDANGEITYDTPVTNDVIRHITEDEVQEYLARIAAL